MHDFYSLRHSIFKKIPKLIEIKIYTEFGKTRPNKVYVDFEVDIGKGNFDGSVTAGVDFTQKDDYQTILGKIISFKDDIKNQPEFNKLYDFFSSDDTCEEISEICVMVNEYVKSGVGSSSMSKMIAEPLVELSFSKKRVKTMSGSMDRFFSEMENARLNKISIKSDPVKNEKPRRL